MPDPHGSLHRAVAELTIGAVQSMRRFERRQAEMGLSEIQQQFQLEISGTSGTGFGFVTLALSFDFPFYYAPGQRDPDFDRPQVWVGAECSPAMAVTGCVTGWVLDPDNGAIVGANVAIGVAGDQVAAYTGVVHLTFQGFSALAEDETDVT